MEVITEVSELSEMLRERDDEIQYLIREREEFMRKFSFLQKEMDQLEALSDLGLTLQQGLNVVRYYRISELPLPKGRGF